MDTGKAATRCDKVEYAASNGNPAMRVVATMVAPFVFLYALTVAWWEDA